jgi:hypothetical protein
MIYNLLYNHLLIIRLNSIPYAILLNFILFISFIDIIFIDLYLH